MIEVLRVIVLACQIHSGRGAYWEIYNIQKRCVRELVQCINKQKKFDSYFTIENKLRDCLLERK
jgi:hypothetical protein